ncbi:MAG: hypothetical protein LKF71_00765 [Oscillospiraceae bacterium]|jgi:hypothetical protein|nr:hypothetical protein [Oscillospiraceae bacterium]
MQQMRQDAIRRAQEMYQRAQQPTPPGYSGSAFSEDTSAKSALKKNQKSEPAPSDESKSIRKEQKPSEKKPADFWKVLFADKERNLVLSILLLLMEEKTTDPALLFAMLYLLL